MPRSPLLIFYFLFFTIITSPVISQVPDSVQQALNKAPEDTTCLRLLKSYIEGLPDGDSMSYVYSNIALDLVSRNWSNLTKRGTHE